MKTRKLTITLILAAVILAPMALAAVEDGPRSDKKDRGQPPRQKPQTRMAMPTRNPRGGDLGQMLLGPMGREFNLTDEQQKKLKTITKESRTETQKSRGVVQKALKALGEAVEEGTEAKIVAAGKTVGDAFTQQALKKAAVIKKVKAELTKEQLLKLEELKAKRKEQMQQRNDLRKKADDSKKRTPKTGGKSKKTKTKKPK